LYHFCTIFGHFSTIFDVFIPFLAIFRLFLPIFLAFFIYSYGGLLLTHHETRSGLLHVQWQSCGGGGGSVLTPREVFQVGVAVDIWVAVAGWQCGEDTGI
jgi:hypothetical protein